jgi:hypothetical protein
VPANFQRFLPILLIVFLLLFVLPSLLHRSSKGKSNTLSTQTIDVMNLVDKAEKAYRSAHKAYSPNLADLLVVDRAIGPLLGQGIVVSLNTSSNDQAYFAQVASSVISLIRARNGDKLITHSCLVIKSGSGVSCPTPAARTTTSTTTTAANTSTAN